MHLSREYIPDLIITDLMMPVLDGLELCQKIKENEMTCHIPVIMLTAKTGVENRITGHEAGADDYLQKPFNMEELKTKVKNLVRQRKKLKEKYSNQNITDALVGEVENMDSVFLSKLSSIIDKNLDNDQLRSEIFEEELCMSRFQLFRKLKALTGSGLSSYIVDHRLLKAEEMLRNNQGNVSEFGFFCGFNSTTYFNKCFKKKYGVAPGKYLKKFREVS